MRHSASHANNTDKAAGDRLVATLKLASLRATSCRREILGIFSYGCKPLNADSVCTKVASKKINQATVYRTLASLEAAGILRKVDLRKGSVFYELNNQGVLGHGMARHHHHIVCTDCGKTESFNMCGIDKISDKVLQKTPSFKTINEHSLELFGVCKPCSK